MKASWLALAVPLVGLGELGAHVYFSHRAPTEAEWAAVQPTVARMKTPGSFVDVAPHWAEPLARWKLGDALMPMRELARPDASRFGRAVEISALGARDPELSGWRVAEETKVGPLVVRALKNPAPVAVTFDFVDAVDAGHAEAEVAIGGQPPLACPWTDHAPMESGGLSGAPTFPANRFRCYPSNPFPFVGVTIIDDERFLPRRCIWSHPPPPPGEMVSRFRGVPLGGQIHGHMGMGWMTERDEHGPNLHLRIRVDGVELANVEHVDGQGWAAFSVDLGAAGHRTADVEFRVSAANDRFRHLCFEADSR